MRKRASFALTTVFLAFVLVFPFFSFASEYHLHLIRQLGIGIVLVTGLNIFFGYCGQGNFGLAAWYAIGAYSFAVLVAKTGFSYYAAAIISLFIGLLVTIGISFLLLRLKHFLLALGTFAFAVGIFQLVGATYHDIFGGSDGIMISKATFQGNPLGGIFSYYVILFTALLLFIINLILVNSQIGRIWKGIRENEERIQTFGVDVSHYKRLAFILNGMYAVIAGILLALDSRWISPSYFDLWANVVPLLAIVIGGLGTNLGAFIGAVFIVLLPELLAPLKDYFALIYGLLLIFILILAPKGIGPALAKIQLIFFQKSKNLKDSTLK